MIFCGRKQINLWIFNTSTDPFLYRQDYSMSLSLLVSAWTPLTKARQTLYTQKASQISTSVRRFFPFISLSGFCFGGTGVFLMSVLCVCVQTLYVLCWKETRWASGRTGCLGQWSAGLRRSVTGSSFPQRPRTSIKFWEKPSHSYASHLWR